MKILVIGKGKIGSLIYQTLKNYYEGKKVIIDNVSFDKEKISKKDYDYIIDFSHPDSIKYYKGLLNQKTKIILGTTNFNEQQEEYLEFLSKMNPIVKDANFSKGILVLKEALNLMKNHLKDYGIEITETHHQSKIDTPSGTALDLQKVLQTEKVNSIRNDSFTSTHEVKFKNPFELVTINHCAIDKNVFIQGIIESIQFLNKQRNGLFTYKDVLGWS